MVYLLEDVTDSDAVGMDLVYIKVPWKSRMKKAEESTRGLAGKLCEIDIVMWSAEV